MECLISVEAITCNMFGNGALCLGVLPVGQVKRRVVASVSSSM